MDRRSDTMKLSDWARKQGIDYKTAYRLYRSGKFPRPTEQLPTGTILVHESARLYGKRAAKNRAERALEATKNAD